MDFYRVSSDELMHYGILGMKWGIRRYQNYDGTYTQKGLERYRKASSNYEKAKSEHKANKQEGKDTEYSRDVLRTARKEKNKAAKNIKRAYLADKGKELYKSGYRIERNTRMSALRTLGIAGISSGSAYVARRFLEKDNRVGAISAAAVAVGASFVNACFAARDDVRNHRLRAYYSYKA